MACITICIKTDKCKTRANKELLDKKGGNSKVRKLHHKALTLLGNYKANTLLIQKGSLPKRTHRTALFHAVLNANVSSVTNVEVCCQSQFEVLVCEHCLHY